jgi:hypothetical protein
MESPDDRDIGLIEHAHLIARPTHHFADDAYDQSRGRDHEWRVGSEVGGDLDAVTARSDADSSRAAVRREQHHGNRKDMGQQICEQLDGSRVALLFSRHLEGDVVVSAEAGELNITVVRLLPGVQLLPDEQDPFPQRASGARGAAPLDLDYGSCDLDDAGVEIDRAAGGQVIRSALPVHHLLTDELARAAEDVLRLHLHAVDDHGEFGFHADRRELDPFASG